MIIRADDLAHTTDYNLITRPLVIADIDDGATEREEQRIRESHAKRGSYQRIIVLSDYHYRNYVGDDADTVTGRRNTRVMQAHDPTAMRLVEYFMEWWQPDLIIYNGDMLDAHQVSKFCKSPRDMDGLEEDLGGVRSMLKRQHRIAPKARKVYLLGNHEARLQNFIDANAPALRGIHELTLHYQLDAKATGMEMYPYRFRYPLIPNVLDVTHGDKVAQKSGYTAQKMLDGGTSGISGHVHRLGMVYKTDRRGTVVWAENGCLCSLTPEYAENVNWQLGFTLAYIDEKEGRFHLDQCPIIPGSSAYRLLYGGQVFEVPRDNL